MTGYYGTYAHFEALSKKDAAALLGSDNIVGDSFSLSSEIKDGEHITWLINKFDQKVGYLDPDMSKKMSLLQAQGLDCVAILSFVAFTDHPDEGHYWGEVGLICFKPAYSEEFSLFIKNVAKSIGDNVRPQLALSESAAGKIIESNGEWMPKQTVPMPKVDKGTAILKRRRSMMDGIVELGRSGNKGCYFVSWAFLLGLVALMIFSLHSCGVF